MAGSRPSDLAARSARDVFRVPADEGAEGEDVAERVARTAIRAALAMSDAEKNRTMGFTFGKERGGSKRR